MKDVWNTSKIGDLSGRVAIVTGANIGLGFETTLALAAKNCEVILACRSEEKAKAAILEIQKDFPKSKLHFIKLDLNSLKSVEEFSNQIKEKFSRLDLLINNAGLMCPPLALTNEGFESQFGVNHLAHFALTGHLLELITNTVDSRIISLASLAHRWGDIYFSDLNFKKSYSKTKAYGQSKLACLMFSYELNRLFKEKGIQTKSIAAHPGIAVTNLTKYFPGFMKSISKVISQPASVGALPTLRAACDESLSGGEYIGPAGFREFKGHPVVVSSSKKSMDREVAKKLWEVSESLTGVKIF
ncbi:short-chain dehydrogenase [Halobacteriovorax marinus]|mgnify:CR=1 FL=1|uniref:Short-chain dehydrogenase n=1 Tax=Halobacteriovorax marinus TaxID=97084 RepID=A0A1Y5FBY0_9BACT|nr:short-chain dehydrogenase [Halobacteriovorax marinus]